MGQVSVTVNGRTYRLSCGDGEEQHLLDVVGHVRGHVDRLTAEHGQIGDERLLLMASILITDELYELRDAVERDASTQDAAGDDQAALGPRIPPVAESAPRAPLPAPSTTRTPSAPRLQPVQVPSRLPPGSEPRAAAIADEVPATGSPPPQARPAVAPSPPVRALDLLDANALMKGLENKVGRI